MLSDNPLDMIVEGKSSLPPRLCIYGPEKIGKSTFASNAPNPIFLQTEDGLGQIDCKKFPLCTTYGAVLNNIGALIEKEHNFETLAIDSADWLERLIHDHVCATSNVKSIELAAGGYGKGYQAAMEQWREITGALDILREQRGMAIILIAHSQVERFEDPESPAYDRYSPKLHKKTAMPYLVEWCDAILFAKRKMRIAVEKTGFNKERAMAAPIGKSGGDRVLQCVGSPTAIAGNRFDLPDEIPLSWSAFAEAMAANK